MHISKNKILYRDSKKPILYDTYHDEKNTKKPVVIFCHGYKGFKDWGAWDLMARAFAEAGFFFVKFNFSHNGGTTENPIDFPDLEAFGLNNYSLELEDLDSVITYITSNLNYKKVINTNQISLIGHSRGGGIVCIKAEEDKRIKNVITWAGVSDYKSRFFIDSPEWEQWKKTGITHVENGRTKQQMPHYWQFFEDFMANEERLTIKRAVNNLSIPLLIIHGEADSTVLLKEAKALYNWNSNSEISLINGADHVFGASHPWNKEHMSKDLQTVVDKSISFLKEN
jgi:pimeloyl-ACP methyl ester carboxylesterase